MKQINSISVSGKITLNMHSLNNEGNEGNQVLTRQVTIIDKEGNPRTVTAVSGDMLKHIMCEHFWKIAIGEKLPLSKTSELFNANRILSKDLIIEKDSNLRQQDIAADAVIKTCSLSDIAGAMITDIGNFSRKSVAEFGWLIALPESNETNNYFHAKYVPNASSTQKTESNEGQNIFHRPANSGIYAFVGNLEIGRLSYNDVSKTYPISNGDRKLRYDALLKSLLYTFLKPNGAMRNTQNPHIGDFEGILTYSTSSCPAPLVSALKENFNEEIQKTTNVLNKITENSIESIEFKSISSFAEIIQMLISDTEPKEIKLEPLCGSK
jgi:CRISPR-associated protein Cst2